MHDSAVDGHLCLGAFVSAETETDRYLCVVYVCLTAQFFVVGDLASHAVDAVADAVYELTFDIVDLYRRQVGEIFVYGGNIVGHVGGDVLEKVVAGARAEQPDGAGQLSAVHIVGKAADRRPRSVRREMRSHQVPQDL